MNRPALTSPQSPQLPDQAGGRFPTVAELHDQLVASGIHRGYVIERDGELEISHPALEPVRRFLKASPDFAHHESVWIGREDGVPTIFFAFVHDTRRGLAQGGARLTSYGDLGELLSDGLRLAQGMTRKNALAGLWWGGGKGIVALPPGYRHPDELPTGHPERQRLLAAYGRFVASLGGLYYTAEDVGMNTADMDAILVHNRFITCISRSRGGSGNPSPHTARGVFRAMQAAWKFLTGDDDLRDVRVAVQGTGNVGSALIDELIAVGARVTAADVSSDRLAALRVRHPEVTTLAAEAADEILAIETDVLAPCARGSVINRRSIPQLRCRLICGAANNILERAADAVGLADRGITYVPDFLCNRMGIVNCADEWQGYLEEDLLAAADRVYPDTLRVLELARDRGVTTVAAAQELADAAAAELHPLMGHRGLRLRDHLVAAGWADGAWADGD